MIRMRQFSLFLGDLVTLAAAFIFMIFVRSGFASPGVTASELLSALFGVFILWLIVLFAFNLYEIEHINPNPRNIGLLGIAMVVNIGLGSLMFYFFPHSGITPKLSLVFAGGAGFAFLILWRRFFYTIFTSLSRRRIFVIGSSEETMQFINEVKKNPLVGMISFQSTEIDPAKILEAIETVGAPDLIVSEIPDIEKLVLVVREYSPRVMSLRAAYEELFAKIPLSLLSQEQILKILSTKDGFGYWFVRNIFDRVIASLVLVVTSPILLLAVLAILIEDGAPIIYRQKRTGLGMHVFMLYKLRSMKKNAEMHGAVWAQTNDPRTTQVGRIIRALHIDEIPQMYNIIKGDIALVGPRPERPEFVHELEEKIPSYYLRHITKPGFTGWAQIKFRYARSIDDSQKKYEYDLYYIKNRSLTLDMGIIAKTLQIIFTH